MPKSPPCLENSKLALWTFCKWRP